MGQERIANTQRERMIAARGRPVLSLEFDVFGENKVSMWAHTRHDIPFAVMESAFKAIQEHLGDFIIDKSMCPFNPDFLNADQK